jgi:hypothetical protein
VRTKKITVGLLAAAAALALAAIALAAPKAGNWSANIGTTFSPGEGAGAFRVTSGGGAIKAVRGRPKIYAPSNFKCNTTNMAVAKSKIPIKRGRFSYKGGAYVNYGTAPPVYKGTLTWKGRFVTKRKVKGTIRFVSPVTPKATNRGPKYSQKECDTGTLNWVGKFSG